MNINKALKALLTIKNKRIVNVAEQLGQTRANISHMLNKNNINTDYLIKYANICGCCVEIKFIDRETGECVFECEIE